MIEGKTTAPRKTVTYLSLWVAIPRPGLELVERALNDVGTAVGQHQRADLPQPRRHVALRLPQRLLPAAPRYLARAAGVASADLTKPHTFRHTFAIEALPRRSTPGRAGRPRPR